jgi:hypothetical protein
VAPRINGISEGLAARLAEVAGQAFSRVLTLQRPWGEFRELIPQSIETLASRGREAGQYAFAPKPKVFVSYDVIRTIKRVIDSFGGKGVPPQLCGEFGQSKVRFRQFISKSILKGVRAPLDEMPNDCPWFPDYAFGNVNDHSGLQELELVPDIRHTAEGVHFLLEYGGCDLDSNLLEHVDSEQAAREQFRAALVNQGWAGTRIRDLLLSIILIVEDKATEGRYRFDRMPLIAIAHLLNLFIYLAQNNVGERDGLAARIDKVVKKLAHGIACDEHYRITKLWKTDSLGDVWGASFLMHLFDCSSFAPELSECWRHAAAKISEHLDAGLVRPPMDDKLFETNIQALLALCKASLAAEHEAKLSQGQYARLSELINEDGILQIPSLEIGEACQLVQLGLLLAKSETEDAIRASDCSTGASMGVLLGALAEQLKYGFLSQNRDQRLKQAVADDAKQAYRYVVRDVLERCLQLRNSISVLDWPCIRQVLSMEGDIPGGEQEALDFHRKSLLRLTKFLGVGWADRYIYPDFLGLQSASDITLERWDDDAGSLPNHFRGCIKKLWSHALDKVRWRPIGGGLSGARVFETSDLKCLPRIIKCGAKAEILSEANRYRCLVEGRLPGAPSMYGPVHWGHTYAIAYENAESRAASSKNRQATNEYYKGRTLGELLELILMPDQQVRDCLLQLYTRGLSRALQCLKSWEGEERNEKRQFFSFAAEDDAFFRFPFPKTELEAMLIDAFGQTPSDEEIDLKNRINEQVKGVGNQEVKISTNWTVHGDFHPRNVYVVLAMRPGDLEQVTKEMRREFRAEHARSVANVALIDFANVTDGEVRCLDFGKYLRDLRARSFSSALNKWEITDEERIDTLALILRGRKENIRGLSGGIFYNVIKNTLKVFSASERGWNRRALLYQELMFLHRLFSRRSDPWGDAQRKYFGGWQSRELAVKACLLGIKTAIEAVEGRGPYSIRKR